MDRKLLTRFGLNPAQASVYLALIEHGDSTAPQTAGFSGETRTNAYTVLDRLVELGLAERVKDTRKVTFRALNPVALEELVRQQRNEALEREKAFEQSLPELLRFFNTHNERPGIRLFEGQEETKKIYEDQIETGEPIYLIHTAADLEFYDFEYVHYIRNKARKAGIKRYAIIADVPTAAANYKVTDPLMLLTRTWIPAGDYTAPVEWGIYGNKMSIISFGREAMGMIIESPQIAEAMRQLFGLISSGLRLRPDYDELPRLAARKPILDDDWKGDDPSG